MSPGFRRLWDSSRSSTGPRRRPAPRLVEILNDAGAVLYVKTNVPQTMMTPDSHNNVFGRVLGAHQYPACTLPFGEANEVADKEYVRGISYVPPL